MAGAAHDGLVALLLDGFHQRNRLQRVAGAVRALFQVAAVDPVLHAGHAQAQVVLLCHAVAELDHLGEVVPRVHVQKLERDGCRCERPLGQLEDEAGILATGKQDGGLIRLACYLAQDVDRFVF